MKISEDDTRHWLGTSNPMAEAVEVITSVANGEYSPENLKKDIEGLREYYDAEIFETQYAGGFGSGSLSDVGLSSNQLTSTWGSGDFDSASLNSSGHQNVFARAEGEEEWLLGIPNESTIIEMWKYHTGNNSEPHHQHQDWFDSLWDDEEMDDDPNPRTRAKLKSLWDSTPENIREKFSAEGEVDLTNYTDEELLAEFNMHHNWLIDNGFTTFHQIVPDDSGGIQPALSHLEAMARIATVMGYRGQQRQEFLDMQEALMNIYAAGAVSHSSFNAETHNHTPHDYYTPVGPSDTPDVSGYMSHDDRMDIDSFMAEFEYTVYSKETGEKIDSGKITADSRGDAIQALEEGGLDDEEFELDAESVGFAAEYDGPSTLSAALSGARKTDKNGRHLTIVQRLVAKYGIEKGVKIYKHFGVKQKRASPKVRGKTRGTKSGPRRYSEGRVGGYGRSQVYQNGDRTGSWTKSGGYTTSYANSGKAWYQERGYGTPVMGPVPDTALAGKALGEKSRGKFVNPAGIVGYPFVPAQQREQKR